MSEEARKAAKEKAIRSMECTSRTMGNRAIRYYASGFDRGWDCHADHTAAIREKAEAVVADYECSGCEVCQFEGDGSCMPDKIAALKAALEGNDG